MKVMTGFVLGDVNFVFFTKFMYNCWKFENKSIKVYFVVYYKLNKNLRELKFLADLCTFPCSFWLNNECVNATQWPDYQLKISIAWDTEKSRANTRSLIGIV